MDGGTCSLARCGEIETGATQPFPLFFASFFRSRVCTFSWAGPVRGAAGARSNRTLFTYTQRGLPKKTIPSKGRSEQAVKFNFLAAHKKNWAITYEAAWQRRQRTKLDNIVETKFSTTLNMF